LSGSTTIRPLARTSRHFRIAGGLRGTAEVTADPARGKDVMERGAGSSEDVDPGSCDREAIHVSCSCEIEMASTTLLMPASSQQATGGGERATDNGRARGTVLLVDDEDLVRESTADMLGEIGYRVVEATSAEEALALIDDGLAFDLLVTDHLMPGMSGVDLPRRAGPLARGAGADHLGLCRCGVHRPRPAAADQALSPDRPRRQPDRPQLTLRWRMAGPVRPRAPRLNRPGVPGIVPGRPGPKAAAGQSGDGFRMTAVVGVIGSAHLVENRFAVQLVGDRNLRAVADVAGALPLMFAGNPQITDIGALLDVVDGILLTGGRANVHPTHFGQEPHARHEPYDLGRDDMALTVVKACVERGIPLFGICRGLQEMNVAFGGSLHPEIRELPGRMNHRMPRLPTGEIHPDPEVVFADRHVVHLAEGGEFRRLLGCETIRVNSLHGQGILEPGSRVRVEGVAEDGTVEAIRIADAPGFALGVQWHAEYDPQRNPVNRVLFEAFGAAVKTARRR